MRTRTIKNRSVIILAGCLFGCAHAQKTSAPSASALRPSAEGLVAANVAQPVTLRLKAVVGRTEVVQYTHKSDSNAYEEGQLRHHKEESLDFTSQAETLQVEPADASGVQRFTQMLSVLKKDGNADLHDFAMPDLGEKLEVTADSTGHIFKSGDYPPNSIFYVPPMSLPAKPVSIGDTWTMEASWLSLEEMVPYQLQMVSILKGFWKCGTDTCAEIEISGDVDFQGELAKAMQFNSTWHGRIFFAMDAGTVVWSRTDSDERLIADKVRRDVDSCLEAVLIQPASEALAIHGERCAIVKKTETQTAP